MFNAGVRGKRAKDGVGFLSAAEQFNQKSFLVPTVTSFSVTDVSYVPLDNTAVDTAGGETIVINGSGFAPGATVQVGATTIGSVTFIDQNRLAFSAPALSSGSYTIYVTNSNGGTGILVSGLVYSGLPTYSTSAGSLGTVYETANINTAVVATGDAPITYSVISGTLPSGATLNSNGTITGNAPVDGSSTTYSFTIQASDGQLQDSTRSFSLTINTDVLTWGLANNTVYTLEGNSVMSNVTLSATSTANSNSAVTFSANTLPTGVSLSGNTIFGTPTVEQTVYSALTATATQTGRTATRFVSWSVSLGDPYWKNTSLLLTGNSPVNTFVTDASTNNFPVTINGDTKPNNFNPFTAGRFSNFTTGVSGTTNKVDVTSATIGGSGVSYTIEGWFYFTAASSGDNQNIFCTGNNVYPSRWIIDASITPTTLQMRVVTESNGILFNGDSVSVNLNTWVHLAVVNDAAFTFYVNGVAAGSRSPVSLPSVTSYQLLCNASAVTHTLPFYVSNYRIVNGAAVYTAAFTPSATPLTAISGTALLAFQTPVLTTTSVSGTSITLNGTHASRTFNPFIPDPTASTYGSGYFDGTGDYLSVADNASFELGSGDFTLEGWFYGTAAGGTDNLIVAKCSAAYAPYWVSFYGGNSIKFCASSTNSGWDVANNISFGSPTLNSWNHFAVSRSGSSIRLFLNGVLGATVTSSAALTDHSSPFTIGSQFSGGNPFTGYISNVRLVKGTAVYTSAFTPPTAPLTAIANTSLLTLQTNQAINNNLFIDDSTNNFAVTRVGNTTQGTFTPYGANWSNYFDGSGDYLGLPANANLTLNGDFTIEFWIYLTTATASQTVFANSSGNERTLQLDGSGTNWIYWDGSANRTLGPPTVNSWMHIALSRSGSTIKGFLNGVWNVTITDSGTLDFSSGAIGYRQVSPSGSSINGYLSNFRIVKGTAVYTANFTPPTAPLTAIANTSLLTCQSNRFKDASTNNFAITKNGDVSVQRFSPFNPSASYSLSTIGGSAYFDGTGDGLSLTNNAAFDFGTGDFTIECWLNTNITDSSVVLMKHASTPKGPWIILKTAANISAYLSNNGTSYNIGILSIGDIQANSWNHIAVTRSGNNFYTFLNGVAGATTTSSLALISNSNPINIGADIAGNVSYFSGYISNLRIVKGTALYTSAFTPPTAPVTATNNTQLLLNFTDAGVVDNAMLNNIETFGDARVSRAVSKFGSGAMYFDGTGDYLSIPSSPALQLSTTTSFTIEAWIYATDMSATDHGIIGKRAAGNEWQFNIHPSYGYLNFWNGATTYQSGITLAANTWYHVAVTWDGTTLRFFVNGVIGTTHTGVTITPSTNQVIVGGTGPGASGLFTGYIDDLRITKGVARYTSNFTPPTSALQTK